jgi:hypothetical protein
MMHRLSALAFIFTNVSLGFIALPATSWAATDQPAWVGATSSDPGSVLTSLPGYLTQTVTYRQSTTAYVSTGGVQRLATPAPK